MKRLARVSAPKTFDRRYTRTPHRNGGFPVVRTISNLRVSP
jgi:hypothetical protein